jgi:hypothetical protein
LEEGMTDYPIDFSADYGDGTRSRGLAALGAAFVLKAVLLIPHFIVLFFVEIAAFFAIWYGYFVIAFTGKLPEGVARFTEGAIGWYVRVTAYFAGMTDEYPPFALEAPGYPVRATFGDTSPDRSRGLGWAGAIFWVKAVLLIPHLVILSVLGTVMEVVAYVGFWVVAITGVMPKGMFDIFTGILRWNVRAWGWMFSLTDRYPPFAME